MQERRKMNRKYLAVYSRVFDRTSGRVLGYLSDLSPTGAMIISDNAMLEGSPALIRMDLPDPALFSRTHLDLDVRVAWSSRDIDPAFFNVGFEFSDLKPEELAIVIEMMETYEFSRANPDSPTSAGI